MSEKSPFGANPPETRFTQVFSPWRCPESAEAFRNPSKEDT
jgi:rubredoxin